jgi:hypothetical protein
MVPPVTGPAEQRAAWAAAVCGSGAVDLDAQEDPAAALAGLAALERPDGALPAATWLEDYDPGLDDALEAAVTAGVRLVVAVPPADGPALAARLGGTAVPQWEQVIGEAAPAAAVCHLVCVNVAVPSSRVAELERAVELLRAANARLARGAR